MSVRSERMLASLPHYYEGEPVLERLIEAIADELDLIDAALDAIRDGSIPGMADDTYGLLGLWELHLGLPVEPAAATLAERQDAVRAALRRLDASSGEDWTDALVALAGTSITYTESSPSAGILLIQIPYDPGSWRTGQIEEAVRDSTPAHLEINMRYSEGFLLDVSLLDQDAL